MIRFAFKCVFFLAFLFIAISFFAPASDHSLSADNDNSTSTIDAIIAVKQTVNDLGNFCDRNVQTCETGKTFLGSLGERARDGAKYAYEYLDSKFGHKEKEPAQDIKTGSIPTSRQPEEHSNSKTQIPAQTTATEPEH